MSEGNTVNVVQFNPLYSQIADIRLKKLGTPEYPRRISQFESEDDLILLVRNANPYCQFEKIEMIESVFEPFPKGSLIVRDTSDIVTYISDNEYKAIYIKTIDGQVGVFEITSVSYLNNAASESDETYVSINFSNFIYFDSESTSLTSTFDYPLPFVREVSSLIITCVEQMAKKNGNNLYDINYTRQTANYALYKPLQSTDSRIPFSNDNIINYCNYLSMYALPKTEFFPNLIGANPRYMFWTGWNLITPSGNDASTAKYIGSCNLTYFYNNMLRDGENGRLEQFNFRYSVYDSDSPSINIETDSGKKLYKKIYSLTAIPATQIKSTRYFYVRKTPKILNEVKGNTYSKLMFQFQDEGEKYDYQIMTSNGVTAWIPTGSTEMFDNGNWGHYDSYSSLDKTSDPTHISNNFGYGKNYYNLNFGSSKNPPQSLVNTMPYIDCAEMWKNQFDLTPVDPLLGTYDPQKPLSEQIQKSFLSKVIKIRYQVYNENKGEDKQLAHIRRLERQNFVAYVLCCLKEQKEESFFAALIGYSVMDALPYYNQRGVNEEPLKYRYSWAKLKLIDDPTAIKLNTSQVEADWKYSTQYTKWASLENRLWILDIGDPPIVNGKPNGEWSGFPLSDLRSNYAINLNERTNWYNATGLTYSDDPLFPFPGQGTTGAKGGYYAPGWHAKSVLDEGFEKIKYRPIGKDIGDLNEINPEVNPLLNKLTYPPMYNADEIDLPPYPVGACNYVEFKKLHIVRMNKTPIIKFLLNSNITDEKLLNFYDGKFIYWFAAENIMDGPCD